MKKWIILAVIILAGCAAPEPTPTPVPPTPTPTCEEATVGYREAVDDILGRWDDKNAIANATSRISLSGPVGELQDIYREAEDIETPPCAERAQEFMLSYMDRTIAGYLSFMAQDAEGVTSAKFTAASNMLDNWVEEYVKLTE